MGKKKKAKREPQNRKIATQWSVNDFALPLVLGFGLGVVAARDLQDPSEISSSSWPFLAVAALYECGLLVYLVLWIRSRRSNMDIELRPDEVWLPPSGMWLRGKVVAYRDITAVEVTGRGAIARRIKIRWRGGSRTYGRDAIVDQLGHVQRAFEKRVCGRHR